MLVGTANLRCDRVAATYAAERFGHGSDDHQPPTSSTSRQVSPSLAKHRTPRLHRIFSLLKSPHIAKLSLTHIAIVLDNLIRAVALSEECVLRNPVLIMQSTLS